MNARATGSRRGARGAPRQGILVSFRALQVYPEEARSRPTMPPPVAEAFPSPSPRASTGPATQSAPSSTGCSRSTSSGTSGSTRNATNRGKVAAQGRLDDRQGLPRLRPARGRLRADPLSGLPGGTPARLLLPDSQLLSELPGEALGAVRGARHHGDPRARPAPPRRFDGMVTNVVARVDRQLALPERRRVAQANRFIRENLERLRREFRVTKRHEGGQRKKAAVSTKESR